MKGRPSFSEIYPVQPAVVSIEKSGLARFTSAAKNVLVPLLVFLAAGSGLTYYLCSEVLQPETTVELVSPRQFPIPRFAEIKFSTYDGYELKGWLIPGQKSAPFIILCPAFGKARSDVLTLAVSLRDLGYNVFTFNFRGHGSSTRGERSRTTSAWSSLGPTEAIDLRAAIHMLRAKKYLSEDQPVGLWGASVGAYAALAALVDEKNVRVIVIDGGYRTPEDFMAARLWEKFGLENKLFQFMVRAGYKFAGLERAGTDLFARGGIEKNLSAKLFISSDQNPILKRSTTELAQRCDGSKLMLAMNRSAVQSLYGRERTAYERRVADFFKKHLPR